MLQERQGIYTPKQNIAYIKAIKVTVVYRRSTVIMFGFQLIMCWWTTRMNLLLSHCWNRSRIFGFGWG